MKIFRLIIGVLFFTAIILFTVKFLSWKKRKDEERYLHEAFNLAKIGRYDEALDKLYKKYNYSNDENIIENYICALKNFKLYGVKPDISIFNPYYTGLYNKEITNFVLSFTSKEIWINKYEEVKNNFKECLYVNTNKD